MKTNTISVNERTNINIFSDNGVWTDRPEVKIYLSVKPDNSRVMLSVCEMILTFRNPTFFHLTMLWRNCSGVTRKSIPYLM